MKSEEFSQLGLVLHLKMNEGIGSIAKDSSPEGNDGTITGATWTNDEKRRMGLVFDGVDDYVDCGNDESLDITDAITIEAWVKLNSGMLDGNYHRIVCKEKSWYFGVKDNKVHTIIGTGSSWITLPEVIFTSTTLVADPWYHVVLVYDDSTDVVEIYVNGVSDGTTTADGFGTNSDDVLIGKYPLDQFWNGSIDEVRIYNRALSASEILAHYSRKKYLMDVQNGR